MGFLSFLGLGKEEDKVVKTYQDTKKKVKDKAKESGGFFSFLNEADNFIEGITGDPILNQIQPERNITEAGSRVKNIRDTGVGIARGIARTPETVVRSVIGQPGAEALAGMQGKPTEGIDASSGEVTDPIRRILYGHEPIKTYQKQAEETGAGLGVGRDAALFGAPLLAGLDLGTGGKGEVAEQLVKASTKEAVEKALIKQAPDVIERLGADGLKNIAQSKSKSEIQKILTEAGQSGPKGVANDVPLPTTEEKITAAAKAPVEPTVADDVVKQAADEVGAAPEFTLKKEGILPKVFSSTRNRISRMGESGAELATRLDKARDTEELFQADVLRSIPTVTKLKKDKFENFVDAVEGKATAMSPEIEQAVKEWQTAAPAIRERAVKSGIEVGDLGPNYFPHVVDYDAIMKDKDRLSATLDHLVETKQATDRGDALNKVRHAQDTVHNRRFGNFESSRELDIPDYIKSPDALAGYIQGAGRRIGQVEQFGPKDEEAMRLLEQLGGEGHDLTSAKEAFDVAVGAKKYNKNAAKASQMARSYQSLTKLGLGAISNVTQTANTAEVTGLLNTAKSMFKFRSPAEKEFVSKTGVVSDSILNDLKKEAGFGGGWVGNVAAPGFKQVENFNRSITAIAGKDYANKLASQGVRGQDILRSKLGITGEIGKELTEEQQIQAARKMVELTQFKIDPQDLPGWASSPGGKLVSQFRTFGYKQGEFVYNQILKPARQGDFKPLARLLAVIPVGYGVMELKNALRGRESEEDPTRRILDAWSNIGGGGLAVDIPRGFVPNNAKYIPAQKRVQQAVGAIGGPTAGFAADVVGAASDLSQGKTDSSARLATKQVPVVGPTIANKTMPYKPSGSGQDRIALEEQGVKAGTISKKRLEAVKKFYATSDKTSSDRSKANDKVDELLRSGDVTGAKKVADAYNKKLVASFAEFRDKYADDVPKDLGKEFQSKKINITKKKRKAIADKKKKEDKILKGES